MYLDADLMTFLLTPGPLYNTNMQPPMIVRGGITCHHMIWGVKSLDN